MVAHAHNPRIRGAEIGVSCQLEASLGYRTSPGFKTSEKRRKTKKKERMNEDGAWARAGAASEVPLAGTWHCPPSSPPPSQQGGALPSLLGPRGAWAAPGRTGCSSAPGRARLHLASTWRLLGDRRQTRAARTWPAPLFLPLAHRHGRALRPCDAGLLQEQHLGNQVRLPESLGARGQDETGGPRVPPEKRVGHWH